MRVEVNLASLINKDEDIFLSGEISTLEYKDKTLECVKPSFFEFRINSIGGNEMYLQGSWNPVLKSECARCLKEVEVNLQIKLDTLMRYDHTILEPIIDEAESGEEILFFGDNKLDLTFYFIELAFISMPYVVYCKEDCKGLCQECGQDLNIAECEHAKYVLQEKNDQNPFAVLKDFNL